MNKKQFAEEKTFLVIPFDDKEYATAVAGKLKNGSNAISFDGENKVWYAKIGADLSKLSQWLPDSTPTQQQSNIDPMIEFRGDLESAGFVLGGLPEMDGKRHRVSTVDDKRNQKSGVYVGYLDGIPAGWYQDHRTHEKPIKWKATGQNIDPEALSHLRAIAAQKKQKKKAEQARQYDHNARRCRQVYDLMPPAIESQLYLQAKGVKPYPGVKIDQQDRLVIPLKNEHGEVRSIQRISGNGFKSLKKNGEKSGNYFVVGGDLKNGEPILYAEGYSTSASITEATGRPVVMTVDAGNLPCVAEKLNNKYPDSLHVMLGDDDRKNRENKGLKKAKEAALLTKGVFVLPEFTQEEQQKGLTDFNDLHQAQGLLAVKAQVESIISKNSEVKKMDDKAVEDNGPVVTEKFEQDIDEAMNLDKGNAVPVEEHGKTSVEDENTIEPVPEKKKVESVGADAKAWLANRDPIIDEQTSSHKLKKAQPDNDYFDDSATLKPIVPERISRSYIEVEGKYYFQNRPDSLAFIDKGTKLQSKLSNNQVASSMVDIAEARGWTELQVKGTQQFRREAWLEATSRGLSVKGYKPKEEDMARLKKLTQDRPANEINAATQNDQINNKGSDRINKLAGKLVEHGKAPYENNPENRDSYYVTLENDDGKNRTTWGVDLKRTINESEVKPGDRIELENKGRQPMQVEKEIKDKNGNIVDKQIINTYRNEWAVKAEAIGDKDRPAREILKEHPDLVNEIAAVKLAEKFSESMPKNNKERFMEKIRNQMAAHVASGQKIPEITIKEEQLTEHASTKEKEKEAER